MNTASLPRFIPLTAGTAAELQALPACPCGASGTNAEGLCRDCWRACVLSPAFGRASRVEYSGPDELEAIRLPRLTDAGGPGGVSMSVALAKAPKK